MSENSDQNIEEATVDELLLKWKQNAVPKELKGLLSLCGAWACKETKCNEN